MIVILKDKQTLEDEMDRGNPIDGLEMEVDSNIVISQLNGLTKWFLTRFKDQDIIYVKKVCDKIIEHFIFFRPAGLEPGTRKEFIERGHDWLFDDKDYREIIYQNDNPFQMINSTLDCEITFENNDPLLHETYNGVITEWSTTVPDHPNPRILSFEINKNIEFYQGCQIEDNEIEFL